MLQNPWNLVGATLLHWTLETHEAALLGLHLPQTVGDLVGGCVDHEACWSCSNIGQSLAKEGLAVVRW